MTPVVYFCREITPENMIRIFDTVGISLPGKVAVKLHSGEKGNRNFLRPEFVRSLVEHVNGTVVESNTAYPGARNTNRKHWKLMKLHGWSDVFDVDILDEEGDLELTVPEGKRIQKNFVGSHLARYDSMLVLSHFKGHPMGGYGGALKQLSIGVASSSGKAYIHGAGEPRKIWTQVHDWFLESMADAALSVVRYFHGNTVYVNVMKDMSVDCDCTANAKPPCMADIGILASADPVAVDQACLDLIYASDDPGRDQLLKRIHSRNGELTLEAAEKLGVGSRKYERVEVSFEQ